MLFYFTFLLVLWIGFRKQLDGAWALVLIAAFATNPVMLNALNAITSDVAFLFLSTLTVVLIGRSLSVAALHQRNIQTQVRCAESGCVAARAGADHDEFGGFVGAAVGGRGG